jgi:hypothetical protein
VCLAPIVKGAKFSKNQCPQNAFKQKQIKSIPYPSAVSNLMYVQVCTKPNIRLIVGSQFNLHTHWPF